MIKPYYFIFKIVLTLFLLPLPFADAAASDMRFYNINSIYGLSNRNISSVCEDNNGFIWASSITGIVRLTDNDYRLYQLPFVSADVFSVRLTYCENILYAFTNNGQIFVFDEVYDRFELLVDIRPMVGNEYLGLIDLNIGTDGRLWLATSFGLFLYNEGSISLIGSGGEVQSIVPYRDSSLFYLSRHGIGELDMLSGQIETLYGFDSGLDISVSGALYDPGTGLLWIGTVSKGVYLYDTADNSFYRTPVANFPEQPVLAIENNEENSVLLGIDGQGVWELSRNGKQLLNIHKEDIDNPFSLRGDGVYDIFRDSEGKVWVATYSGGLSYFKQEVSAVNLIAHKMGNQNSLGNNHVNKIIEDRRGNLWFGTNNGISRWDRHTDRWDNFYQDKNEQAKVFLTLCKDDGGNIWAGTYSSGVYLLDGERGRELRHYIPDNLSSPLSGKFVFDIFKDSHGDIWIGGIHSDIICYLKDEGEFRAYRSQPVRTFAELAPGKIVAACSYGLLLIDKETGREDILLTSYLGQDLIVDGDRVWLATGGDGLILYDTVSGEVTRFGSQDGLCSDFVNSITAADGYFWLGTENGFCRFDPESHAVVTYPSYFSLTNLPFNVNADTRLSDGSLIFGTNNGAVLLEPDKMYSHPSTGRIYFNDLSISGRSIRENPELIRGIPVDKQTSLSLHYFQNNLALEMLPIGVSYAGYKFSWQLEGLDTRWSRPTGLKTITYTNLPPGTYNLKIRMLDDSISEILDERTLRIDITPPVWGRGWFRAGVFAALAGLLFFLLKTYINRMRRMYAEDKIRFFANTAHDIRTSLTLISAPVEELTKDTSMREKSRYYVNLIAEQAGRLSSVATQLLDFQKVDIGKGQLFPVMADVALIIRQRISMFDSLAGKKNITLELRSAHESYLSGIDMLKIEKVVDNLISNAIKYSHPGGSVEVVFEGDKKRWSLEVRDHGLGISENARKKLFREFYRGDNTVNSKMVGSGIGLLLVKNYVTMHKGRVSVSSKVGAGSTFRIWIPYRNVEQGAPVIPQTRENTASPDPVYTEMLPVPEPADHSQHKPSLLVVEDNLDLQRFLRHSLSEHYRVSVADDGNQAMEIIRRKIPDLIVSDVVMLGMDGFELCKTVKSTFETSHIPFILLTTLSDKTHELEGLGLGADDYITKPFDITVLNGRIASMVRNREMVRERALGLFRQPDSPEPVLSNEFNDKFVKKAIQKVRENIENTTFGKEEFASAMNVSGSLLYKKIKSLTGQAPVDFIKTIRLDHALGLIRTGKYNVTEVSELCGFSSVGYFSTVFKKHFGYSPAKWNENNRGNSPAGES